ncbi:MAG: ATP:cob(I)alamin adenosyltransferase, partial [Chloroflexi bacterium]|nr:ATP:cob(I)alamin adenosyltransferase [Chloroflexota bacterium]
QMDALSQVVEIPKEFIIPGDQMSSAWLDLARTVVRRAERRVVELLARGDIENWDIEKYLNRLSSLCFVMELVENRAAGSDNPTLAKDSGL